MGRSALILIRCVFIGFTAHSGMQETLQEGVVPYRKDFIYVDIAFGAVIAAETILRASLYRSSFFQGPDRIWNAYACLEIPFLIFEVVSTKFQIRHAGNNNGIVAVVYISRVVYLLRVFRAS